MVKKIYGFEAKKPSFFHQNLWKFSWMTFVNLLFSRLKHLLVEEFIFVGFNQLTVQKKMSFGTLFVKCCCQVKIGLYHYFVLFFYFLSSDDHIFLFERSQYMPVLIVHRLIQFSKEENWFYKRLHQTFQKWRKNYRLSIFQILLTGATLDPEINSLCR